MTGRFRIEKVELHFESEGPDYFTRGEWMVIDSSTGDAVAAFPWSLDETYLTTAQYSGPDDVLPSAPGADRILDVAEAHRDLFGEQRPAPGGPTLDEIFLDALRQRLIHAPNHRARELARREAASAGRDGRVEILDGKAE